MTTRYTPMIVVAEAAAMMAGSVGVAIIAAAPSTADPIYDLCITAPPEDLCHVIWNVPVDPSIPHYPRHDDDNSTPQGPADTACIASPTGPCVGGPYAPTQSQTTPQPIVPAAPMPTFSDPFPSTPH